MITIEEKINVFNKLVLGHVQSELEEKQNEINEQNSQNIEDHKKKLQQKKEKIIQDYITKGEREKNKLISQSNIDKKRKILAKKQEFIERVMNELYKMAEEFCKSQGYEDFIEGIMNEILPKFEDEKDIIICLNKTDSERLRGNLKALADKHGFSQDKITINILDQDLMGGVIVFNKNKTLKMDYSLDTIIEENKWRIGQKIHDVLLEAGDING